MKLILRLAVLFVAGNFLVGILSRRKAEMESERVIVDPVVLSLRSHLKAAAADAFEWAAYSLREHSGKDIGRGSE